MKSVVSETGRVTIPKPLRERLGIRPGEVLEFAIEDGRLVAARAGPIAEETATLRWLLRRGGSTDEVIGEMRGPAPLP